jgi:transcriptional regulator with XRE-family HTH domain
VATSLGTRIRTARTEAGLTAEQLAPLIGVTMGTLLRWERDEFEPSVKKVRRIAEETGKPLAYFISSESKAA